MKITKTEIQTIISEMCKEAGFDETYETEFSDKLISDESLLTEFVTYILTKKFTCENKVRGYSVVDILVWQMDHFKTFLDREQDMVKNNECAMILNAFDTFIKLKHDPDKYVDMLTGESGSDYDGKF